MLESSREESSVGELLAELLKYPAGPAPVELAALPCRAPELAVLVLTLRRTTEMWDGTSEKLPGPAPVSSPSSWHLCPSQSHRDLAAKT